MTLNKLEYDYGSWAKKYNLECDRMHMREEGQTVYFAFVTLVNFMIFILTDKFGRRPSFMLCGSVFIGSVLAACFVDDWFARMALMGAANGCESSFANLFNVIINESTRKFTTLIVS